MPFSMVHAIPIPQLLFVVGRYYARNIERYVQSNADRYPQLRYIFRDGSPFEDVVFTANACVKFFRFLFAYEYSSSVVVPTMCLTPV